MNPFPSSMDALSTGDPSTAPVEATASRATGSTPARATATPPAAPIPATGPAQGQGRPANPVANPQSGPVPSPETNAILVVTLGPSNRAFHISDSTLRCFRVHLATRNVLVPSTESPGGASRVRAYHMPLDAAAPDLVGDLRDAATREAYLTAAQMLLAALHVPRTRRLRALVVVDVVWRLAILNAALSLVPDEVEWLRECLGPFLEKCSTYGDAPGEGLGLPGGPDRIAMRDAAWEKALRACLVYGWSQHYRAVAARLAYLCWIREDELTKKKELVKPDWNVVNQAICGEVTIGEFLILAQPRSDCSFRLMLMVDFAFPQKSSSMRASRSSRRSSTLPRQPASAGPQPSTAGPAETQNATAVASRRSMSSATGQVSTRALRSKTSRFTRLSPRSSSSPQGTTSWPPPPPPRTPSYTKTGSRDLAGPWNSATCMPEPAVRAVMPREAPRATSIRWRSSWRRSTGATSGTRRSRTCCTKKLTGPIQTSFAQGLAGEFTIPWPRAPWRHCRALQGAFDRAH
ncbi:hypothetical protein VTK56DRAFT_5018 [Thermocarpiscus australiensis]